MKYFIIACFLYVGIVVFVVMSAVSGYKKHKDDFIGKDYAEDM